MGRAYAVKPIPIKRKEAHNPLSVNWSLYNPQKVADELNVAIDHTHEALRKNGYFKATRIREELIKWKIRMQREQKEISLELRELNRRKRELRGRYNILADTLQNVRNMLRIPR